MRRPYRLLSSHTPSNSKLYSHTTAKPPRPTPRPWPRGGPISGRNSEVLLYFALSLLLVDVSARATTTEVVAAPAFQIPLGVKPKPLVGIVKRGRKSEERGRTKSKRMRMSTSPYPDHQCHQERTSSFPSSLLAENEKIYLCLVKAMIQEINARTFAYGL